MKVSTIEADGLSCYGWRGKRQDLGEAWKSFRPYRILTGVGFSVGSVFF